MTRLQKTFVLLFFFALVLPYPLYWAAQALGLADLRNYENRDFATWQDVQQAPLREKSQKFEDFLGDHAAFRNEWMSLNAGINLRVFDTVQSNEVLLGREDWLFYKNVSDSRSLDDYQGINLYSEAQIAELSTQMQTLQDALSAQGTQLVVLIAPAKESVYSAYMPAAIPRVSATTKADALVEALSRRTTVPILYPKQALTDASAAQQVYYRYDTHWNDAGALLAAQAVQRAGLRPDGPLFSMQIAPDAKEPLQDLAALSATYRWLTPDTSFAVQPAPQATLTSEASAMHETYTGDGAGTLLMLHDSFGKEMRTLLAGEYENSVFIHHEALSQMDGLLQKAPDVFVMEVAERYTDRLFVELEFLLKQVAH